MCLRCAGDFQLSLAEHWRAQRCWGSSSSKKTVIWGKERKLACAFLLHTLSAWEQKPIVWALFFAVPQGLCGGKTLQMSQQWRIIHSHTRVNWVDARIKALANKSAAVQLLLHLTLSRLPTGWWKWRFSEELFWILLSVLFLLMPVRAMIPSPYSRRGGWAPGAFSWGLFSLWFVTLPIYIAEGYKHLLIRVSSVSSSTTYCITIFSNVTWIEFSNNSWHIVALSKFLLLLLLVFG